MARDFYSDDDVVMMVLGSLSLTAVFVVQKKRKDERSSKVDARWSPCAFRYLLASLLSCCTVEVAGTPGSTLGCRLRG